MREASVSAASPVMFCTDKSPVNTVPSKPSPQVHSLWRQSPTADSFHGVPALPTAPSASDTVTSGVIHCRINTVIHSATHSTTDWNESAEAARPEAASTAAYTGTKLPIKTVQPVTASLTRPMQPSSSGNTVTHTATEVTVWNTDCAISRSLSVRIPSAAAHRISTPSSTPPMRSGPPASCSTRLHRLLPTVSGCSAVIPSGATSVIPRFSSCPRISCGICSHSSCAPLASRCSSNSSRSLCAAAVSGSSRASALTPSTANRSHRLRLPFMLLPLPVP